MASAWWAFAEQASWGVAVGDLERLTIAHANQAFAEMHGYGRQELRALAKTSLWDDASRPALQELRRAVLEGQRRTLECLRRRKDGSTFPAEIELAAMPGAGGTMYICMVRDIAARVRARARLERLSNFYAVLSQCGNAVIRCGEERELFARVCRDAVQIGGMRHAWIGLCEGLGRPLLQAAAFGETPEGVACPSARLVPDSCSGCGLVAEALRDGNPVWCRDFAHDPRAAQCRNGIAGAKQVAAAVLPLHRSGAVIGAFMLYADDAAGFDHAARDLLAELAMMISFALDNFVREAARRQAEADLRESEASQRALLAELMAAPVAAAPAEAAQQEPAVRAAPHLLLVSASQFNAEVIAYRLRRGGFDCVLRRADGEAAFRAGLAMPLDLVIVDLPVAGFDEDRALRIMRDSRCGGIPVIVLSDGVRDDADAEPRRRTVEYLSKVRMAALPDLVRKALAMADIRERQRQAQAKLAEANAHLARLSTRMIEIQEQERKSLAREMHDELGQRLTLLKIGIHQMREFLAEPRARTLWERADAELDALIDQTRAMSGSLRPPSLDYLGLEAAVRQLLESQFTHAGIDCVFEFAGVPERIPAPLDITAYRIVQEGATNIVKHAGASLAVVEINGGENGDEMEVVVRDNGKGFDPGRIMAGHGASRGHGLLGLRERIGLLGGSISVESSVGIGTRLVCVLPLTGMANDKN